jgi:catechol 2,3-dioxygenase-like lactoylglutathione lyase family enzyme
MTPTFSFIGIVVADIPTSLAFYRKVGLEFPADADDQPHVEVDLPGGLRIAWDDEATIQSFDESWVRPSGGHRVALAFDCGTPADVDATYLSLTESGATGHLVPWDAFWAQRYAVVLDPDGNHVELFAPLEVTP